MCITDAVLYLREKGKESESWSEVVQCFEVDGTAMAAVVGVQSGTSRKIRGESRAEPFVVQQLDQIRVESAESQKNVKSACITNDTKMHLSIPHDRDTIPKTAVAQKSGVTGQDHIRSGLTIHYNDNMHTSKSSKS